MATATKSETPEDIRTQLSQIEEFLKMEDLDEINAEFLRKRQSSLTRKLNSSNKAERTAVEEAAKESLGDEAEGLKIKVVPSEDYEEALTAKSSDERAQKLMDAAEDLDITLEPGEIIVIKKGSAVRQELSEQLTKKFKKELAPLGDSVIQVSKGSVGGGRGGGPRGDIPFEVGTILTKKYKDTTYEVEVIENGDGKKLKGEGGALFDSVSGAASAITNYPVRGTTWWEVKEQSTN